MIGKDNLFAFDEQHPHQYMQKAILRAKELQNVVAEPVAAVELQTEEDALPALLET